MNEKAISAQFVEAFSGRFDLYEECWLRHPLAGNAMRIDFIGFDKKQEILGPIGFEIKDPARWDGHGGHYNTFTKSLAQCMDYQQCLINSQFKNECHAAYFGKRLRFTFLFKVSPRMGSRNEQDGSIVSLWAEGQLKLAASYGVGVAYMDQYESWTLSLGGHRAFSVKSGARDLILKHTVAERAGSAR